MRHPVLCLPVSAGPIDLAFHPSLVAIEKCKIVAADQKEGDFQFALRGPLEMNDRVEIKRSDYRGGSGIFRYNDAGLNPTLRDVITQMIITSDNTATDIMIAKVGALLR